MIYSSGQNDHVALQHLDPDPAIFLITSVKVSAAVCDEANLLVGMNVLLEKCGDLKDKKNSDLWKVIQGN